MVIFLLWVGSVCLANRHLHQTGTLTVDAMEECYQNNSECLEEDLTDKVCATSAFLRNILFL